MHFNQKGIYMKTLALVAWFAGWVSSASESLPTNALPTAAISPSNNVTAVVPTLGSYIPDDKYKLRIGDRIAFQILEDRDQAKYLVVADSGELDLPYIGRVAAVGKTCKQVALECKSELEKEFYYRATVIIGLDAANRLVGRVYVWGQVRNQGPVDISATENLTAGKAILRAGGFADFANKKRVKVVRTASSSTVAQTFEVNLTEILEDGKTDKDLLLQSDDFIIVPSRLINF
jgi:protein involved in polysaccharide export with SLBB domain